MPPAFGVLLAAFPLLLHEARQEAIRLGPAFQKGDRVAVTAEAILALEGKRRLPETEEEEKEKRDAEDFSFRLTHRGRHEDEVTEATAGRPSEVRREIARSTQRLRRRSGDEDPQEENLEGPLHGRRFTLRRDGDETKALAGAERLPDEGRGVLEIDPPFAFVLPKERVEEGESWNTDAARLRPLLRSSFSPSVEVRECSGALACRFRGYTEIDEKRCAEVSFEGNVDLGVFLAFPGAGAPPAPTWSPLVAELEGTLLLDPAAGRLIRVEAKGALSPREGRAPDADLATSEASGEISLVLDFARTLEAGEGPRLALRLKAGDVFTKKTKATFEYAMESFSLVIGGQPMDMGGEAPEQSIRAETVAEFEEEVLKAEGGKPVSVRVKVVEARTKTHTKTAAGSEESEEDLLDEDTVVVATLEGTETTVEVESGKVSDEKKRMFRVDDASEILLPEEPVGVGATWSVDGSRLAEFVVRQLPRPDRGADAVRRLFRGLDGSIECRLAGFEARDGARCARIALRATLALEASGKELVEIGRAFGEEEAAEEEETPEGVSIEIGAKASGEFFFAVEEGRPVALELSGPITLAFEGDQTDGEMEIEVRMKGSGTLDLRYEVARGRSGSR